MLTNKAPVWQDLIKTHLIFVNKNIVNRYTLNYNTNMFGKELQTVRCRVNTDDSLIAKTMFR